MIVCACLRVHSCVACLCLCAACGLAPALMFACARARARARAACACARAHACARVRVHAHASVRACPSFRERNAEGRVSHLMMVTVRVRRCRVFWGFRWPCPELRTKSKVFLMKLLYLFLHQRSGITTGVVRSSSSLYIAHSCVKDFRPDMYSKGNRGSASFQKIGRLKHSTKHTWHCLKAKAFKDRENGNP